MTVIRRRTQALQAIPRDLNMAVKLKPVTPTAEEVAAALLAMQPVIVPPDQPPPTPQPVIAAISIEFLTVSPLPHLTAVIAHGDTANIPPGCFQARVRLIGTHDPTEQATWTIEDASPYFSLIELTTHDTLPDIPPDAAEIFQPGVTVALGDEQMTLRATLADGVTTTAITLRVQFAVFDSVSNGWTAFRDGVDDSTGTTVTFPAARVPGVENFFRPVRESELGWRWWNQLSDFVITVTQTAGPDMAVDVLPYFCNYWFLYRPAGEDYSGTAYEIQLKTGLGEDFGPPLVLTCET